MSVKYLIKTHDLIINDSANRYFSAERYNAALATAEKLFVTAITTNTTGTTPSLGVNFESSNDGLNWSPPTVIISAFITAGATTVLSGQALGTSTVFGRYLRLSAALGGAGVGSYVRVWVCGRSLV